MKIKNTKFFAFNIGMITVWNSLLVISTVHIAFMLPII